MHLSRHAGKHYHHRAAVAACPRPSALEEPRHPYHPLAQPSISPEAEQGFWVAYASSIVRSRIELVQGPAATFAK